MKKLNKSLFVTTIAMVVLLVVALSTATFAWYTAQSTVTTNPVTITSAASTSANIAIGWTPGATTTQVTFKNSTGLFPMVPTTDPAATTEAALSFNQGQLSTSPAGQSYFRTTIPATPWKPSDAEGEGANLYIINNNPNAAVSVQLNTFDIAGDDLDDIGDLLRVAFYTASDVAGEFVYLGTYGTGTAYYGVPHMFEESGGYAAALESEFKTEGNKITLVGSATDISAFNIAAVGSVQLHIYAWLEGTTLTDGLAAKSITFNMSFFGSEVTP